MVPCPKCQTPISLEGAEQAFSAVFRCSGCNSSIGVSFVGGVSTSIVYDGDDEDFDDQVTAETDNPDDEPGLWRGQTEPYLFQHDSGRFRIIEDDGCYIVLTRARNVGPDAWLPAVWLDPEIWRALRALPEPRGALYDIDRDGPMSVEEIQKKIAEEMRARGLEPPEFKLPKHDHDA